MFFKPKLKELLLFYWKYNDFVASSITFVAFPLKIQWFWYFQHHCCCFSIKNTLIPMPLAQKWLLIKCLQELDQAMRKADSVPRKLSNRSLLQHPFRVRRSLGVACRETWLSAARGIVHALASLESMLGRTVEWHWQSTSVCTKDELICWTELFHWKYIKRPETLRENMFLNAKSFKFKGLEKLLEKHCGDISKEASRGYLFECKIK